MINSVYVEAKALIIVIESSHNNTVVFLFIAAYK